MIARHALVRLVIAVAVLIPAALARADIGRGEACAAAVRGELKPVAGFLAQHRHHDKDDDNDGQLIDALTEEDGTLLHCAAQGGNAAIATLLLDRHAAIDVTNRYGHTPLFEAAERGADAVVAVLLARQAGVDLGDEHGKTPLHVAAEHGHAKVAKLLVDHGAKVDVTMTAAAGHSGPDATPLVLATLAKSEATVKVLLDAGANPNIPVIDASTRQPSTLLEHAVWSASVVQQLLAHGAKIDGDSGLIAMFAAADAGDLPIVKLLIANGVPADGCYAEGPGRQHPGSRNLLDIAATRDDDALARFALAHHVPVSGPPCSDGVLDSATGSGTNRVFDLILAQTPSPLGTAGAHGLFLAAETNNAHAVIALLDRKVPVDGVDGVGASALHYAVAANALAVVNVLLARGANVNRATSATRSAKNFVAQPHQPRFGPGGPLPEIRRCNIQPLDLAVSAAMKALLQRASAKPSDHPACADPH